MKKYFYDYIIDETSGPASFHVLLSPMLIGNGPLNSPLVYMWTLCLVLIIIKTPYGEGP